MAKIAPKLQAFVPRLAHRDAAEGEYHAGLLAELRALLAVARAARYTLEIIQWSACGCGEPTGSGKGLGLPESEQLPMDGEVELERALARLARVSGRKGDK